MMQVATRSAAKDDIPLMLQILGEAEDEIEKWRGGKVLRESRPPGSLAELLERCLEREDMLCLLATLDDVAVGIGLAGQAELANGDPIAKIQILYVLNGARGVGAGAAIMAELAAWAETNSCIGLDATALPGDRNTKNFFESHGMSARSLTLFKHL